MAHFNQRATALALAAALVCPALAHASEVSISLADGVITPQTVEVPADTEVTLKVTNAGATPAEFESKQLHIETIIAPGQSADIALRALPAGSYGFVEEFHENLDTARGTIVAK